MHCIMNFMSVVKKREKDYLVEIPVKTLFFIVSTII